MSGRVVLLPVSEAAERAQVVDEHVRSAIRQGSVTAIDIDGRFMVNQDALDHWARAFRADLGRETPAVGPCPAWCTLMAGHSWEAWVGARAERVHLGPDFGPAGEVSTFVTEHADTGGQRESIMIGLNGGHELASVEAHTLAEALRAAAGWVSQVENEARWWRQAANPPCAAWCQSDHDLNELSAALDEARALLSGTA